jgi:hypothetical protein
MKRCLTRIGKKIAALGGEVQISNRELGSDACVELEL